MSMTLVLWKAPLVDDEDEAKRLLEPYYEREDDSAFEPSADIAAVSTELLRRYPYAEDGPWADFPHEQTERLLLLSIRWSADDAVLDAIEQLAREHELVLYDPQGPHVQLPTDPIDSGPTPPPRFRDYLAFVLIGLAAAGVFWLGWRIDVPVLDWILMIIGGFGVSVVVFLLAILLFGPKDDARRATEHTQE
jgi:hypothetical protein